MSRRWQERLLMVRSSLTGIKKVLAERQALFYCDEQ